MELSVYVQDMVDDDYLDTDAELEVKALLKMVPFFRILVNILQPLALLTDRIGGRRYPTLAHVAPQLLRLMAYYRKLTGKNESVFSFSLSRLPMFI